MSATEQFLKDLMVQREQRAMEKGGERAGVGKFQQAGLEENKSLHMTTKTTTGDHFTSFLQPSYISTSEENAREEGGR